VTTVDLAALRAHVEALAGYSPAEIAVGPQGGTLRLSAAGALRRGLEPRDPFLVVARSQYDDLTAVDQEGFLRHALALIVAMPQILDRYEEALEINRSVIAQADGWRERVAALLPRLSQLDLGLLREIESAMTPGGAADAGPSPRPDLDPLPWVVFADEGGIVMRAATKRHAARWCMAGESIEFAPREGYEKDPALYGQWGAGA
jgi:hypothetical protein